MTDIVYVYVCFYHVFLLGGYCEFIVMHKTEINSKYF